MENPLGLANNDRSDDDMNNFDVRKKSEDKYKGDQLEISHGSLDFKSQDFDSSVGSRGRKEKDNHLDRAQSVHEDGNDRAGSRLDRNKAKDYNEIQRATGNTFKTTPADGSPRTKKRKKTIVDKDFV